MGDRMSVRVLEVAAGTGPYWEKDTPYTTLKLYFAKSQAVSEYGFVYGSKL